MNGTLIFVKEVDKSTLYQGVSIPIEYQQAIKSCLGFILNKGDIESISIELNGIIYNEAIITNQIFDSEKFPNRSDIIQIRYNKNSNLATEIRKVFASTASIVDEIHSTEKTPKKHIKISEENKEYIKIYAAKHHIRFECLPLKSSNMINDDIAAENPQRRESTIYSFNRNPTIVEQAKIRANGICQLCQNKAPFNDKKGNPYLEVHHIIWLSRGGMDTLNNVAALCPNCHSKMHIVDDNEDVQFLLSLNAE